MRISTLDNRMGDEYVPGEGPTTWEVQFDEWGEIKTAKFIKYGATPKGIENSRKMDPYGCDAEWEKKIRG